MDLEVFAVREVDVACDRQVGQDVDPLGVDDADLVENFVVNDAACGQVFQIEPVSEFEIARLDKADHLVRTAQGADGVLLGQARQVAQILFGRCQFALAALVDQRIGMPPGEKNQHARGQPDHQADAPLAGDDSALDGCNRCGADRGHA